MVNNWYKLKHFVIALCLLGIISLALLKFSQIQKNTNRGENLYIGESTIEAKLAGQADTLPKQATRCQNCHENKDKKVTGSYSLFTPTLNKAWLTISRSRHGGPPSSYDVTNFCTLLRQGIDPVHVTIPTIMPRYNISDDQCKDLWTFLNSR